MQPRAARIWRVRSRWILTGCGGLIGLVFGWPASGQSGGPRNQAEVRAELIVAGEPSGWMSAGLAVPAGEYLRLGGDLGIGASVGHDRGVRWGGKCDVYGRFHLDPFAESRWAPYLIAGGSLHRVANRDGRLDLLVGVGVEGPRSGGFIPAFEVGLGGGVRVGFALRRPRRGGR